MKVRITARAPNCCDLLKEADGDGFLVLPDLTQDFLNAVASRGKLSESIGRFTVLPPQSGEDFFTLHFENDYD